ncbi:MULTISPECIES: alpha/beta hydrolase family protein [unclassified Rhodococcus (in: high G+C Gram-positive bacteria)]|uniref:alpha/beta hydrolase n=1 Tax=unclassified Rhodococcus (in: high G+C Gram-positive bacteria) TaxID=192944 RepID=UPI001B349454|nr:MULTISPECIES: alpha/beta hydrolase family protein [unclassified Rhodococcus (in: high G+C Gram-positive bacteria)]
MLGRTKKSGAGRARRVLTALMLAVIVPAGLAVAGTGATANAAFDSRAFDFVTDSSMGPIKSRIWRAADGNTNRVVYLLDGLRATNDISGWEHETDVGAFLASWNINVVEPVGGQSSFYSDWYAPSNFNGQQTTYKWETFLTENLRNNLSSRLGFNPNRNGVVGISMGGSAALTLAAYHPDQFSYAGSLSGYLNISAPGMREAMRLALLDSGRFNIDAMWGPPWDPAWLRNDPFVFAPRLRDNGTRVWVFAGSGLPGGLDQPRSPIDYFNTGNAMGLEAIALANSRAFQIRMASLGANNVTYAFPAVGTHQWGYWQEQAHIMAPDLSANIG